MKIPKPPKPPKIRNRMLLIFITIAVASFEVGLLSGFILFDKLIYDDTGQEIFFELTYKTFYPKNNKITTSLANNCTNMTTRQQVDCVSHFIFFNYKYIDNKKSVKDPEELLEKGGDCVDYSMFSRTVFEKLDFEVEFKHNVPKHIFINVKKDQIDW